MIHHYFAFQDSIAPVVDLHFDILFTKQGKQAKEHITEKELYEKTPIFQNPFKNNNKTTLTSSGSDVLRMISHALSLQNHKFSISFAGESCICDHQITYFKNNSQNNILFINSLAEQVHLIPENNHPPLNIRLGALRKNIASARNFLVDSIFIFFNINSLKWSDSPAQSGNNTSGLTSEEANQLAYLAGQSHKNKFLILYGFENLYRDPENLSLNSALQILWYYQYGATHKAQEWPIRDDQFQEFTIESKMSSANLIFRKDLTTGHWFHKLPFDLPEDLSYHQWIATSYDEYLAAADDNIPLRILAMYDAIADNISGENN